MRNKKSETLHCYSHDYEIENLVGLIEVSETNEDEREISHNFHTEEWSEINQDDVGESLMIGTCHYFVKWFWFDQRK